MQTNDPPANAHPKYVGVTASEPESTSASTAPDVAGPKKDNTDSILNPRTNARIYYESSPNDESYCVEPELTYVRSRTEAIP